ncbi:MAG TPA: efflux transporter outer membrane subunit [Caulobacteraceae bacterium]|jgi:multidrug efflux system outer membrane protein|nr:efflux transporter outer membrane subunit [Caulobacteraceae bacterium]
MRRARPLLAAFVGVVLAGCAVGPNFKAPSEPPRAAGPFVSAQGASDVTEQPLPSDWWRLYNDPVLDRLVLQALQENEDLKTAAANLLYAQFLLQEARDNRFPATDLTAEGPAFGRSTLESITNSPPSKFFSAGFTASYQVDIFGRIRRSIEAARANAEAVQAAEDVTRVTVAAQTAAAYANVCGFGEQIVVARQNLALVQQVYDLTLIQRDAGFLADFDLSRERVVLEQTRSAIPPLEGQRRANLFVLAALIGKTPREIPPDVAACVNPPTLSQPIPVGDGKALLRRRPDLREAERNLAAATARIGVATADLYPTISIGGGYSASALTPGGLGKLNNATYSVGPLLNWTFPNVLIARDHIREAGAQAQANLASFDSTVLTALSETEQALATYTTEIDHNRILVAAQKAANEAYSLSHVQFQAGSYSFLDLLTIQSTVVQANQAVALSDTVLATDQIGLFETLGGGWENAPPVTPPPAPR